MAKTTSIPTAPPPTMQSARDQFLDVYDQEHTRTLKVLRAYPKDKAELRPHPRLKTARELAWIFVTEQGAVEKALTTGFDWTNIPAAPKVPDAFCTSAVCAELAGVEGPAELDAVTDTRSVLPTSVEATV